MGGLKAPGTGALAASPSPLASILSKVEITPESILSALSKSQAQASPGLQGELSPRQSRLQRGLASSFPREPQFCSVGLSLHD